MGNYFQTKKDEKFASLMRIIRENETDILLEDYLEQVKNVVYASRLLSNDVARIVTGYVGHPYYDIIKKIRVNKFNTIQEGISQDWNCIITEAALPVAKNTMFRIERIGDISFNIRYNIIKELFVQGEYNMEVHINSEVRMKGKCIIEDNGDFYTLWSPGTSFPIPLLCLQYNPVFVAIIDQFGVKHTSGTLTSDYFLCMSSDDRRRLVSSNLITIYNTDVRDGLSHMRKCFTYDKLQELEIFPGIKQATHLFTTPIVTQYG